MAARPVVLPDTFNGEANWDQWIFHFESVAEVNEWTAEQKMKWLKVRLTGRAQAAFQHLSAEARGNYERATKSLRERFEPESRRNRYEAEFQTRRKNITEAWADFAEDLRTLADKAYPELQEEARERLALNAYLTQLDQPQVAFAVKQKGPKSLDAAVSATLEMESYMPTKAGGLPVSGVEPQHPEGAAVAAVTSGVSEKLANLVEKLAEKVERLEQTVANQEHHETAGAETPLRKLSLGDRPSGNRSSGGQRQDNRGEPRRPFTGDCWRCGRRGHIARNCRQQGN